MKQYSIYIINFLIGLFLFSSCQDEELIKKTDVVGGIPVSLSLNVSSFAFDKVVTKADMGAVAENKVNDLHVFVFKGDKSLEDQAAFSGLTDSIVWPKSGTLTSGNKYIVAVANVNSDNMTGIDFTGVKNMDDLKNLIANLNGEMLQRPSTGGFVMSGYWGENAAGSVSSEGYCTISDPKEIGQEVTLSGGQIWLRHLDSKIKFDVQLCERTGADGLTREFVPRDWKVVNVPNTSNLFMQDADAAQEVAHFFDTEEAKFEVLNVEAQKYNGGSFTFYMLENRKDALNSITQYAKREYKGPEGGGPEDPFVNADSRSSYVVLRGTYYEYKQNGEINLSADVRYTIHLGYAKGGTTEAEKAPDFDSERNYSYTYNVKIQGVKDIILEVTSSQDGEDFEENQPGAEGDVITSTQNLLFDAHYEVGKVTFYRDELSNLSVMIRTPYEQTSSSEGIFKLDSKTGALLEDNLDDYKWVEFVKNPIGDRDFQDYSKAKAKTDQVGL